jgi:hypothetical protein
MCPHCNSVSTNLVSARLVGQSGPPLRKHLPGITFSSRTGFPTLFEDFVCVKRKFLIYEVDAQSPCITISEIHRFRCWWIGKTLRVGRVERPAESITGSSWSHVHYPAGVSQNFLGLTSR